MKTRQCSKAPKMTNPHLTAANQLCSSFLRLIAMNSPKVGTELCKIRLSETETLLPLEPSAIGSKVVLNFGFK